MPNITNFPTGRVGIGTENPQQTLDVAGTLRVTGSTGTPNSLMGRNASGDVGVVGVGSGLGIDGFGQLYATGGASGSTSGSGSTNQVAYWTGMNVLSGENNLWWDFSADRLGIGTNAPARSLDVIGGIRFSAVNGTPTTVVGVDASGDIGSVSIGTGLDLSAGVLSFTGSTGGSGTVIGTGTTNYLSKWASASGLTDSIVLETGNTIDINGSLRVRTSSGTATNVMGRDANGYVSNIAVGNGLSVSGGILSTTGVTFGTGADGRVAYWTGTNQIGNDNNFLWDAENDRLGIGVFPTSALHISSADSASIRIVKTGTSPADFSLVALNGKLDIGNAFTITDTGRLGLGTNTPAQTLDVAGNMRLTGSTGTSATVMGRSVDGDISAISVGSGLSLSGNVLSATGGGGGGVSGSGTATQVAFWNGTTSLTGNTNLYWDNNNNRLGIGTSSPSNQLTTTSDALISTLTIGRGNFSLATNTAVGVNALVANVTSLSSGNTAIGYFSLSGNAGVSNTAIGYLSAIKTTGNFNVAVGSDTLTENIGGASNTAVGRAALSNNTSGSSIVAIGANALSNNITGNSSVAVGASAGTLSAAGTNLTTASSSIFIGASSRASNISPSNQIVIGTSAVGLADNATVIGTTGTTQTHLYGNLTLGLTSADTTARVKATSSDGSSSSFAAKFQNNSGTDILSVRGDGVVGIGTTSPAQTLDIRGTMRLTGSTGDSTTVMGRNANGDVSAISVGSGLSLSGNTLSTTGTTGVSGSGTATQVAFWGGTTTLSGSSNLYWDNTNGRLGIGQNSPAATVHIRSQSNASGAGLIIENPQVTPTGLNGSSIYATGNGQTTTGANNSELLISVSGPGSGNITDGPFFAMRGNNYSRNNNQRGWLFFYAGQVTSPIGNDGSVHFLSPSSFIDFQTTSNATSRLRIINNGNIGIGTTTPNQTLEVAGTMRLTGSTGTVSTTIMGRNANGDISAISTGTGISLSSNIISVTGSTSGSGTLNYIPIWTSSSALGNSTIFQNGNLTGLRTVNPTAVLHVLGTGTTTGTTFLTQASGGTETFRILDNGNVGVNIASPTARLYVKGSTSGNGSTAFEVTDNTDRDIINVRDDGRITLGRNLASNVQNSVTLEAAGTADNISIAIVPKGNGGITASIPDNSATGGGIRGWWSTDLQTQRVSSTQIASGNYSVINGGYANEASGNYSVINGGQNNTSSGAYSAINGGSQNISLGSTSAINGGEQNYASEQYTSINGGFSNYATATVSSVSGGIYGSSYLYGQNAISSGRFAAIGDAQTSTIRLRRQFTGTATTELYLDGISLQAILQGTNRIWNVRVQSVAVVTVSGGTLVVGDTIAGEYGACIRRIGTTTTLISEQTKIFEHATGNMTSAVSITISADNGTEALKVTYQPPAAAGTGTTFRVVATVYITEVGF